MAKDLGPQCKRCRREGEKLFLKGERCYTSKCAIVKRNYAPGSSGGGRRMQMTEYGTQLRAKQKVKRMYGLREAQFRNTFEAATQKKGNTGEFFVGMLEARLDNAVYRAGFAQSRRQSRQFVTHGHFLVNKRKVTIPSYVLREGDVVEVSSTKAKKKIWEDMLAVQKETTMNQVPEWLAVDKKAMKITVAAAPQAKELVDALNVSLIVEFYSK
ncbi:MAG: 30S ribosomal protein S4 [Candidatus Kerfeldbacteria bacterium RIFCSPHIGHO2_12_FULL_48_17]|uniref:Small ribosomal subunit protein uS4 n=1 Tax=Candidatus Kerfeldbacteria bacterium RIFCSPHIGHO2_12_FULL_48_17 TaxID=1798542 RepID=A0A1G2AXU5_9BACT|nr:MAG: 30S ribosomal protein S4 [Candidatus Kerfeldbacteria bacterium RIFCSPHIGHO2_12_FULL_48_17]